MMLYQVWQSQEDQDKKYAAPNHLCKYYVEIIMCVPGALGYPYIDYAVDIRNKHTHDRVPVDPHFICHSFTKWFPGDRRAGYKEPLFEQKMRGTTMHSDLWLPYTPTNLPEESES